MIISTCKLSFIDTEKEADEYVSGKTHEQQQQQHNQQDQNGNTKASSKCSPHVTLWSAKMIGMHTLLLADKLNSQALSLQLTAQSQVCN